MLLHCYNFVELIVNRAEMIVKVKKFGNSKGIILPKKLMEICEINDQVSLTVEDNHIIISPSGKPRSGWDEQFKSAMVQDNATDYDLLNNISNEFDEAEWTW
jgi:antitoxin MazE